MVALKRMKALGSRIWRSMNQERRGGIETAAEHRHLEDGRPEKQERCGGIETALARFLSRQSLDIAAPPQRGIPRIG